MWRGGCRCRSLRTAERRVSGGRRDSGGRVGIGGAGNFFDRSKESVTRFRHGLDENRIVSGIVERKTQPFHCAVQAEFKIDIDVGGPEAVLQFLASDELAGFLEQDFEDAKRLFLDSDPAALLVELPARGMKLKEPEPDELGWHESGEF
jgi:hypothetical protein